MMNHHTVYGHVLSKPYMVLFAIGITIAIHKCSQGPRGKYCVQNQIFVLKLTLIHTTIPHPNMF